MLPCIEVGGWPCVRSWRTHGAGRICVRSDKPGRPCIEELPVRGRRNLLATLRATSFQAVKIVVAVSILVAASAPRIPPSLLRVGSGSSADLRRRALHTRLSASSRRGAHRRNSRLAAPTGAARQRGWPPAARALDGWTTGSARPAVPPSRSSRIELTPPAGLHVGRRRGSATTRCCPDRQVAPALAARPLLAPAILLLRRRGARTRPGGSSPGPRCGGSPRPAAAGTPPTPSLPVRQRPLTWRPGNNRSAEAVGPSPGHRERSPANRWPTLVRSSIMSREHLQAAKSARHRTVKKPSPNPPRSPSPPVGVALPGAASTVASARSAWPRQTAL